MEQKTVEQALESLRRTCAKMERCKSDAMRSLYRFGIDKEKWDGIIESLVKDRYIDENRYAESFVREKSGLQKWGSKRIRTALRMKGIPAEYIENALESCITEEKESENLMSILVARKGKLKETDSFTIRRKLFAYAAGKGYEIDDINDTLDIICQN